MPRHGKKFAMNAVRAVPESLDGKILTDYITAPNDNYQVNLAAGSTPSLESQRIEGVVVKALPAAQSPGVIGILQEGKNAARYFPLEENATISIATDNLNKVIVLITAAGDSVAYCAIAEAVD